MNLLKYSFSLFQAVAGLISDARQICETARSEASNYRSQYRTPVPLKYLNERVSMYMHAYTLYSAVRPYGCSVVLGTWTQHDGPQMFMLEPSGVSFVSYYFRWYKIWFWLLAFLWMCHWKKVLTELVVGKHGAKELNTGHVYVKVMWKYAPLVV